MQKEYNNIYSFLINAVRNEQWHFFTSPVNFQGNGIEAIKRSKQDVCIVLKDKHNTSSPIDLLDAIEKRKISVEHLHILAEYLHLIKDETPTAPLNLHTVIEFCKTKDFRSTDEVITFLQELVTVKPPSNPKVMVVIENGDVKTVHSNMTNCSVAVVKGNSHFPFNRECQIFNKGDVRIEESFSHHFSLDKASQRLKITSEIQELNNIAFTLKTNGF